jgi:serine/threonine-protein kinase TTK/MPS1
MASPTPMGSSHFAPLSRRPSSRQIYRQPPSRPHLTRTDARHVEKHEQHYSLNDSSDDEMPLPMKFSAETKALLNDEASMVEHSPLKRAQTSSEPETEYGRVGNASEFRGPKQNRISPPPPSSRIHSPYPRRVVRLSGTPGSSALRRASSLSSAVKRRNEQQTAPRPESPLDLSTPAPVPRTVRIPITHSGRAGLSSGSSGRRSDKVDSASRNEEISPQEYPATVARSHLANSQGSVSRYGSTIGRMRYGEEVGLQSGIRLKTAPGGFLKGPARRGRRKMDDEEQSPVDELADGLDGAGASQEPHIGELRRSQEQNQGSSQESEPNHASLYPSYRDYASGSPISSKDLISSMLRSTSPPPPTLSSSKKAAVSHSSSRHSSQPAQPVFKLAAPPPDLPSTHDQENEAPPTFKRNQQAPLIHLDKMEKVPVRPASIDLNAMRKASPERRPLAQRSHNTPRRPAPPPPKMSILDAATSTAGAATTSHANSKRNKLKVNGKQFTRLDCIGRGGSSRVYRVMAENSKFFALKRVSLDDADEETVRGFKGEIDLLKKLEDVERVIRLYDWELNEEKATLSVVSLTLQGKNMRKLIVIAYGNGGIRFE